MLYRRIVVMQVLPYENDFDTGYKILHDLYKRQHGDLYSLIECLSHKYIGMITELIVLLIV